MKFPNNIIKINLGHSRGERIYSLLSEQARKEFARFHSVRIQLEHLLELWSEFDATLSKLSASTSIEHQRNVIPMCERIVTEMEKISPISGRTVAQQLTETVASVTQRNNEMAAKLLREQAMTRQVPTIIITSNDEEIVQNGGINVEKIGYNRKTTTTNGHVTAKTVTRRILKGRRRASKTCELVKAARVSEEQEQKSSNPIETTITDETDGYKKLEQNGISIDVANKVEEIEGIVDEDAHETTSSEANQRTLETSEKCTELQQPEFDDINTLFFNGSNAFGNWLLRAEAFMQGASQDRAKVKTSRDIYQRIYDIEVLKTNVFCYFSDAIVVNCHV